MLLGQDSCIGDNEAQSLIIANNVLDNSSEMTDVLLVYEDRYKSDIISRLLIVRQYAHCIMFCALQMRIVWPCTKVCHWGMWNIILLKDLVWNTPIQLLFQSWFHSIFNETWRHFLWCSFSPFKSLKVWKCMDFILHFSCQTWYTIVNNPHQQTSNTQESYNGTYYGRPRCCAHMLEDLFTATRYLSKARATETLFQNPRFGLNGSN